ncbi:MAG: nickel pincer cofactor biosynthesis protein LarB [Verrucomicrobia bacterium]|nr:nickel pincer cofactor biosynthesis protein LarB [Verrucomicrobiota bacterium]
MLTPIFRRDRWFLFWHGAFVIPQEANELLERFLNGEIDRKQVIHAFQAEPLVNLGYATVDTQRSLRKGFPEVVFGAGKTREQVVQIAATIFDRNGRVLITRITQAHAKALRKRFRRATHHVAAACVTIQDRPLAKRPGTIAVLSAGTSDMPIAEEAAITAEFMGNRVQRIYDVGIAGLHRVLARLPEIQEANVLVVAAGMEGALPSVVAGLVSRPVIAVPTSVGYGASFGGIAALLGMLNSCGTGVTVVNIDNGFGAGYAASQINTLADENSEASVRERAIRRGKRQGRLIPQTKRRTVRKGARIRSRT